MVNITIMKEKKMEKKHRNESKKVSVIQKEVDTIANFLPMKNVVHNYYLTDCSKFST